MSEDLVTDKLQRWDFPSTKSSPSIRFVWAPAHGNLLLQISHSAVQVPYAKQAVVLLTRASKKRPRAFCVRE